MNFKRAFLLLGFLLSITSGFSQNLEEIGISKGLDFSGSLNLNTIGYLANGIDHRRDPFNWFLTGNLNVNLFGYSAPFSFSYSNVNKSYSQPFNQFSFSPQYKWVKTYIGYNSMTFSNYTLAGHVFYGGGVDLSPGKWRISAMYGRLRKAVEFNLTDSLQYTEASYKRMGFGLKVGYENNGDAISANIFSAKDDVASIPFVLPESQLTPKQNVAISIAGRKRFLKRFFIDAEYAVSALNHDILANGSENDSVASKSTNNLIKGLLPENSTSRYYDALNASIGYQGNWYSLQIKYERVAPEYQTLGAYFFNNDMRNITLIPTVRLFKNSLTLSGNAGFQRNNLDDTKASTTKRFVGSVNANYLPNEKWNFTASYSNFSSYTNMKPQVDPNFQNNLDTLNFYQISETMMGTIMRNLGKKENPQTIMLNLSYQKASDQSSYEGGGQTSDFISTNVSYTYSFVPSSTTIAVSANVYSNNAAGISSTFYGPTASITKAFLEKTIRGSFATSYNKTSGDNIQSSPVLNNRISVSYSPKAKGDGASNHNFSLGINVLSRLESTEQQASFTEFTGTLNYTYTF
jgi:hypothetical protein